KDADQFPVVSSAKLRGSHRVCGKNALNKSEILFMTRRSFNGHKGKKGCRCGSGPSIILTTRPVPGGIRTPNLLIRSQLLYPVELQTLCNFDFRISIADWERQSE